MSAAVERWLHLVSHHACADPERLSAEERLAAAREGRVLEISRCPDGFGGGDLFFERIDEAAMHARAARESAGKFLWPIVVFRDHAISDDDLRALRPNPWEDTGELPAFAVLTQGLTAARAAVAERMRASTTQPSATTKQTPASGEPPEPKAPARASGPAPAGARGPKSELAALREQLAHYDRMMSATRAMGGPDASDVSDRYGEYAQKWADTLRRIEELEKKRG